MDIDCEKDEVEYVIMGYSDAGCGILKYSI